MKLSFRRKDNGSRVAAEQKIEAQEQAAEAAIKRADEALRRSELLQAEIPPPRDVPIPR